MASLYKQLLSFRSEIADLILKEQQDITDIVDMDNDTYSGDPRYYEYVDDESGDVHQLILWPSGESAEELHYEIVDRPQPYASWISAIRDSEGHVIADRLTLTQFSLHGSAITGETLMSFVGAKSESVNMYQGILSIAAEYKTSAKADISKLQSDCAMYLDSDRARSITGILQSFTDSDSKVSNYSFIIAMKNVFEVQKHANDEASYALDASSPFVIRSLFALVGQAVLSSLPTVVSAIGLALGGIWVVLGFVVSAVWSAVATAVSTDVTFNDAVANACVEGPAIAASFSDEFGNGDQYMRLIQHGPYSVFYWNYQGKGFANAYVSCLLHPTRFLSWLQSGAHSPLYAYYSEYVPGTDPQVPAVLSYVVGSAAYLWKIPETAYLTLDEQYRVSSDAAYARWVTGWAFAFAALFHAGVGLSTFNQSQFHATIGYGTEGGSSPSKLQVLANGIMPVVHILADREITGDADVPDITSASYLTRWYAASRVPSLNARNVDIHSIAADAQHLTDSWTSGEHTYNTDAVCYVNNLYWLTTNAGSGHVDVVSDAVNNDDYTEDVQLPDRFFVNVPSTDAAALTAAVAVTVGLTALVAISAMKFSRALRIRKTAKNARRINQLNKEREALGDDPSSAQLKQFASHVDSYNRKARLFGWGTYDAANGWQNDPVSVSTAGLQNTISDAMNSRSSSSESVGAVPTNELLRVLTGSFHPQ